MGRLKDQRVRDEYLDTIIEESERLSRLLNNVLDFSKIEQGKKIYRPELVPPVEVVEAAARAMRDPMANLGFVLRVEVEEDLGAVYVDRDALEQAILNLLSNAMKYSDEQRSIELQLKEKDGEALIQVRDRGVGIPADEQARIFDDFYRVQMPKNQQVPGTGLGLALVDHFAKAHGGRVEVESTLGEGSTFSIHLPLRRPASNETATTAGTRTEGATSGSPS